MTVQKRGNSLTLISRKKQLFIPLPIGPIP